MGHGSLKFLQLGIPVRRESISCDSVRTLDMFSFDAATPLSSIGTTGLHCPSTVDRRVEAPSLDP